MQTFRCTKCAVEKPREAFHADIRKRSGVQAYCKVCQGEAAAAWYQAKKADPEWVAKANAKSAARQARIRREDPAGYEAEKQALKAAHKANPAPKMWASAKRRAMNLGLAFAITLADIVVPSHCPVLGIPLEAASGPDWQSIGRAPSLDRIKPELGYVPGNVVVISYRANRIKCDATPEELARVAAFVSSLT